MYACTTSMSYANGGYTKTPDTFDLKLSVVVSHTMGTIN